MKSNTLKLFIAFIISFCLFSCENEVNEYPYKAEVLGVNMDCGIHQIKIIEGQDQVEKVVGGKSAVEDVYIAYNLPENLKQPNVKIELDLRMSKNEEIGACRTMGPALTWITVVKARKLD